MKNYVGISFVTLAVLACTVAGNDRTKLKVDVYYESLCPDSIYFITKELAPAYKDFKDYLQINLIPFGKASWVVNDETKTTAFTCQHGPNECRGNRAQACALYEIAQTLKPEDQQQKMLDVVNCAMSNRNPASAVTQCARGNTLSVESIDRIDTCSRTNLGIDLLVAHGEKTKALESPLTFVPTIVIDGVKKTEAFRNFAGVICQLIPNGERPNACAGR